MMNHEGKKVGIVTLYSNNFGSCLQAFALYACIKDMGYAPTLIRYRCVGGNEKDTFLQKLSHIPFKTLLYVLFSKRQIQKRKSCFNRFRSTMFTFTEKEYLNNDERKELNNQFDVFVCGSDMMWCEVFEKDWEQYFLRFVSENKRVAYAPSFGVNQISDRNYQRCLEFLSGFPSSRLSCRDIMGVQMIREKFGLNAHHVLDPTMLFDKNQWNGIIGDKSRLISKSYVLTYLFGGTDRGRRDILKQVRGWDIGKLKSIDVKDKNAIKKPIGPFEFVRLFRDAEFIITDTFHGLMFSLIFEKPFVVLTREDGVHWTKYSDRITSTLEMLGISERYWDMNKKLPGEFRTLDYRNINTILNEKRSESIRYLHGAIEEVLRINHINEHDSL